MKKMSINTNHVKRKRWFIFINQYSHCVNINLFYLTVVVLQLNYTSIIFHAVKKKGEKKTKTRVSQMSLKKEKKRKEKWNTDPQLCCQCAFWTFLPPQPAPFFSFLFNGLLKHLLADTKALPDNSGYWIHVLFSANDLTRTLLSRHWSQAYFV